MESKEFVFVDASCTNRNPVVAGLAAVLIKDQIAIKKVIACSTFCNSNLAEQGAINLARKYFPDRLILCDSWTIAVKENVVFVERQYNLAHTVAKLARKTVLLGQEVELNSETSKLISFNLDIELQKIKLQKIIDIAHKYKPKLLKT